MSPCSPLSPLSPLKGRDRGTDFGTICPTTIGTDGDRGDRHEGEGRKCGPGQPYNPPLHAHIKPLEQQIHNQALSPRKTARLSTFMPTWKRAESATLIESIG